MSNQLKKFNPRGSFLPSIFNDNDFFTNFFDNSNLPAVNISESKKEFNIEVSAAGFDKSDFSIEIEKNVLTISANKEEKKEEKDENEKVLRREFSSSSFSRSFVIPENIDAEHISAQQKDGILKISLPKVDKLPEEKVKKIEIK